VRYLYGCTAADVTTLDNGRVYPLRAGLTCWYSFQGPDRCTDLTDLAGDPVGALTSDAFGAVAFYGPDGYAGPLWLDLGRGARVLVRPVDPGDSRPAPMPITWKSANISAWNIGEYADDEAILAQVQALGVNVVTVPVQVAADDIYDSTPTINEASMDRALEVAALLTDGVQIIAEPYPWVDDGNQSETLWEPFNVATWFTNWGAACVEVAEAFPQAAMVYLGANLVSLEAGHDAAWAALAASVRAVTDAALSYRCNWWYEPTRRDALAAWPFLSQLDIISVAAYFELTPSRSPDYTEVRQALHATSVFDRRQNVVADLQLLSEAHDRPVFLGELNCGRCEFALSAPWNPLVTAQPDAVVQAHLFRAYTEVLAPHDWFHGFSVFNIGDFGDSQYRLTPAAVDYIASIPVRGQQ
jgi:hypothetical protein